MKKLLPTIAAYPVSFCIAAGLIKLAMAINAQLLLQKADGLPANIEAMRVTAGQWIITLLAPVISGAACGLVFTLLARPRVLLRAGLYCISYTIYALATVVHQYSPDDLTSVIMVQLLYPVSLFAFAAVGKKIASVMESKDREPVVS